MSKMEANADMFLAQLLDMGYPIDQAAAAIERTKAVGLDEAVSWLIDNPEASGSPANLTKHTTGKIQGQGVLQPQDSVKETFNSLGRGTPCAASASPINAEDFSLSRDDATEWQSLNPAYAFQPLHQNSTGSESVKSMYASRYPVIHGQHQQQQDNKVQAQSLQWQSQPRPSEAADQRTLPQQQLQPPPRPPAATLLGVASLLEREQRKTSAANDVMDAALQDLQALMQQAQDMVELAQQFRAALAKQPLQGADEQVQVEADDVAEGLLSFGIEAPVTKATAGKHFDMQLARELKAFLPAPMERAGGFMTLPDIFCLINRARGLELVSPDDLLQAVKLMGAVGAPFELQELEGGTKILQSLSHSTEQVCRRMAELAGGDPGDLGRPLTVPGVASVLRLPVSVAQKQLLTAETHGFLCRDEGGIDGLRFYRNFFVDLDLQPS